MIATSATAIAPATETATVAPLARNATHFAGVRFQTITLRPALSNASASALPMLPRPITQATLSLSNAIITDQTRPLASRLRPRVLIKGNRVIPDHTRVQVIGHAIGGRATTAR